MTPEIAIRPTKLTIQPREQGPDKKITVLFNPTSYSVTKPVTYTPQARQDLDAPLLVFGGGGSRTLSLRLFFDVTEHPTVNNEKIDDVRKLTNKFVELSRIERGKNRPPVCDISWGDSAPALSDFPFPGVMTNLVQEFTLFESDGRPVRANLTVSFLEFQGWEEAQRKTDPEFTTYVVRRGDTLSSIAAQVYNDPSVWRVVADANHLDDPRHIEVGQALNVPKKL